MTQEKQKVLRNGVERPPYSPNDWAAKSFSLTKAMHYIDNECAGEHHYESVNSFLDNSYAHAEKYQLDGESVYSVNPYSTNLSPEKLDVLQDWGWTYEIHKDSAYLVGGTIEISFHRLPEEERSKKFHETIEALSDAKDRRKQEKDIARQIEIQAEISRLKKQQEVLRAKR